jgi:glycosyltransferase involved in cell wall biosynthesis
MKNHRPRVTFAIPTHNRSSLLHRAARSVLLECDDSTELLIVDDASTDDTAEVVASLDDPRVRYIRRPVGGGAAAARNTAIREARSEWVSFLDDDDEFLPGFFAAVVDVVGRASPQVGFGWCGIRRVRDTATGEEHMGDSVWTPWYTNREEAYRSMLRSRRVGTNCGFTIRKSAAEAVGYFDESLRKAEDTDILIRLARSFDFFALPGVHVKVHVHAGPRLTAYDKHMAAAYEAIALKHKELLDTAPELAAEIGYKIGWLHYHAGNKPAGRRAMWEVLRRRSLHVRAWGVMILFESLGSRAVPLHRFLSR